MRKFIVFINNKRKTKTYVFINPSVSYAASSLYTMEPKNLMKPYKASP